MAAKFFFILACVALSQAAVVKRDAPDLLADIGSHATELQKTFTEQVTALTNSENSQAWQKTVKEGADSVLGQLTSFSASLQNMFGDASGKAKESLEMARANLEKTAEDLRRAHPEVEAHANELKDKLQAAVQSTLQESQKLAKAVSANVEQTNEKLAPQLKQAYEAFVRQAQEVQKKLHDAASKQ